MQLIGRKSCKNTRKAERYLKERNIDFQFLDLDKKELSEGELYSILLNVPAEELIDKTSREFGKKGLKYMEYDPQEEMFANQKLIKTPILRDKNRAIAGFDEALIRKFTGK